MTLLSRFFTKKTRIIDEEDLLALLKSRGFLEKIEKGELTCSFSSRKITLENLEAIIPSGGDYKFVSRDALVSAGQ